LWANLLSLFRITSIGKSEACLYKDLLAKELDLQSSKLLLLDNNLDSLAAKADRGRFLMVKQS
jgi:hypothetical protein